MLLGLLSGEMAAVNLVDLAVLQSACDVLMRTVRCVDMRGTWKAVLESTFQPKSESNAKMYVN